MKYTCTITALVALITIYSCKQTKEPDTFEKIADYYPLTVGKSITYRMDSSNYVGYTTTPLVTSYFIKDSVHALITDNMNRPSYRIFRFIKKNMTDPVWQPNSTYFVTPLSNTLEYIENNLRYVKLLNPIANDNSWKGNNYIETSGPNSQLQYLQDWDYQYTDVGTAKTYNGLTFAQTATVKQVDKTDGDSTVVSGYSERNISVEVYGKGVGLLHKNFLHWIYQPPTVNGTPGYRAGYGIRLTIVARN